MRKLLLKIIVIILLLGVMGCRGTRYSTASDALRPEYYRNTVR